ncbi:hypothetical protein D3C78_1098460 [compost metagenome]
MAGRHVNADMKSLVGREIANLADRFGHHVARQGNNQIMFLRQRNKYVRRYPALTGIVPAQKDLHADAFLRAGIE